MSGRAVFVPEGGTGYGAADVFLELITQSIHVSAGIVPGSSNRAIA